MKVVVSKESVRQRIREILTTPGMGWQSTGDLGTAPVSVSSVVDPSASKTDPGNSKHVPTNRMELRAAVSNMIDDISDDEVIDFYSSFKDVILSNEENEEKEEQEMRNSKKVEEMVRRSIRRMLMNEAGPYRDTGLSYSGPMVGNPAPRAGMQSCETCEGTGELPNGADCPECKGTGQVKAGGRKNLMMTDVSGASFKDIATEMGYASESGAKKAVELALQKARFVATMDENELEIIVLTAMNDYVEKLNKTGELSPADVKLLKDHPNIVSELDGFREFLDGVLRKARKSQPLYNPIA